MFLEFVIFYESDDNSCENVNWIYMLIIDFAELLSILISDFSTSICSIFNFNIL